MASAAQSFARTLKMLRDSGGTKEKREALTYIRSNARKLEGARSVKEEQYKELCRLLVDAFASDSSDVQHEAYNTLNMVVHDFKDHNLNLFDSMLRTSRRNRLKILKMLEVAQDSAVAVLADDTAAMNFFDDCMYTVDPGKMEWIKSTSCTDDIKALASIENTTLSEDQRLEEELMIHAMCLLKRLYKIAAVTSDTKINKFDEFLMDKVVTLAYMGHKRQRGPALKLLQQALATNLASNLRERSAESWSKYKTLLQSTYCKRMSLLVGACEPDWATQWNVSIQFLGTDLHRGAGLINSLLGVEEKAFKSTDAIIRRQAFLSWKLLIDNFALDPQELATARRIKLLCIPLNAKNSKTELIALTKLEVWWHLIVKLYKDLSNFVDPVLTQFLNFCFGPLGDTPLMSSKFDVVASPGKRFYKTKVVALDALCQLLVTKQESRGICSPMLEERLPHSIPITVFEESWKSVDHSVAEALLVLGQLTDKEMKKRHQLGETLWTSLMNYFGESKKKEVLRKDLILVISELATRVSDTPMIKDLILDVILPKLPDIVAFDETFGSETIDLISELILKLLAAPTFGEMKKNHSEIVGSLMRCSVKPNTESSYRPNTLELIKTALNRIEAVNSERKNIPVATELWLTLAEIATQYTEECHKIEERKIVEHDVKILRSILAFPFSHLFLNDTKWIQDITNCWKKLYQQFEIQSNSTVPTLKPSQILLDVTSMLQNCLNKNEECSSLVAHCLDALLRTISYECLLVQNEVPSILQLTVDLVVLSFNNARNFECGMMLKVLSSLLNGIHGQNATTTISCLQVCKPALQSILTLQSGTLFEHSSNLWRSVTNIFRSLGRSVTYDLISSYEEIIIAALNHGSSQVQEFGTCVLSLPKADLNANVKVLLNELNKRTVKKKQLQSENMKKQTGNTNESKKPVKTFDSFLNGNTGGSKSTPEGLRNFGKGPFSESDSQEYVLIESEVKFDVTRLTEHQKEVLKKKREDIPALYNDLSQSCSQDTQNLQHWFDLKTKRKEEADKQTSADKLLDTAKTNSDKDADKENEIDVDMKSEPSDANHVSVNADAKSATFIDRCISIRTKRNTKSCASSESGHEKSYDTLHENDLSKERAHTTAGVTPVTGSGTTAIDDSLQIAENINHQTEIESVAKRLNFESREEFPDENRSEKPPSPSVLESNKRRSRSTVSKATPEGKLDVHADRSDSPNDFTRARASTKARSVTSKQKQTDSNEQNTSEKTPRGTKRKSASDSESESSQSQRRRRKLTDGSDEDSSMSVNSLTESTTSGNQRMKSEMSRLKIDMVFDGPLQNRRRSDIAKDKNNPGKQQGTKRTRQKSTDSGKKPPNNAEKEEKTQKPLFQKKRSLGPNDVKKKQGSKENDESQKETAEEAKNSRSVDEKSEAKRHSQKKTSSEKSSTAALTNTNKELDKNEQRTSDAHGSITTGNEEKKEEQQHPPSESDGTSSAAKDSQNASDLEDFVESSQEPLIGSSMDGVCNNKNTESCSVKSDENAEQPASTKQLPDAPSVQGTDTSESVPMDAEKASEVSAEPMDGVESESVENAVRIDEFDKTQEENALLGSDGPDQEEYGDDGPEVSKNLTSEVRKMNEDPSTAKAASVISISPKTNVKRYPKLNAYAHKGRAAHMLGLVTKQALQESDSKQDDDVQIKKLRSKETESEGVVAKKDRPSLSHREPEKLGGPCGSRQEKIFNNMRSSDYCSSPPLRLFSNLKNDGEKVFLKSSKSTENTLVTRVDASVEKENDGDLSPSKDELPMLEWSSANPPSLTASPSASILKRQRSATVPEPDPDCVTPNKRKRVSFADPPVSKEMGYEIAAADSPHKTNRLSTPRSLPIRRDSPLRKQMRLKSIQIDSERVEKEEEIEITAEIDLQCERENELLSKIAEELEYSEHMAMDPQTSCFVESEIDASEMSSNGRVTMNDDISFEVRVSEDSIPTTSKTSEKVETCKNNDLLLDRSYSISRSAEKTVSDQTANSQTSETQEDIFILEERIDAVMEKSDATTEKLDVTSGDEIVAQSCLDSQKAGMRNENLEDTVDIENVTGLNSTANSDDVFCDKLVRTSTKTADVATAEEDTLPVTDSLFASLPSQESQIGAEIPQPELLDSTHPICPELISCQEPLALVIDQLTNPLWQSNLSAYFRQRSLVTVGDLARLTEREVNRVPVKGNPKVEFVKNVLRRFEMTTKEKIPSSEKTAVPSVSQDDGKIMLQNEVSSVLPAGSNMDLSILESTTNALSTSNEMVCSKKLSSSAPSEDMLFVNSNLQTRGTVKLLPVQTSNATASNVISAVDKSPVPVFSLPSSTVSNRSGATTKTVSTCTDPLPSPMLNEKKASKSVESQMALEDLLDEIDVNLVLQSAARRCTAQNLLSQYKMKMRHLPETELGKETIRLLGLETRPNYNDVMLKSICRTCGINKVLLRLPDIFSGDKQFFVKVLNAYRKKIKISDCLDILDFNELKEGVFEKCTSSEISDMLSRKLKDEEHEGVRREMTESSTLNAMLKRMPMDVIISHTVANEDLIPSRVVLDIALQNNGPEDITRALESQSSLVTKSVFDKLWSTELAKTYIETHEQSRESLLTIFKSVSSKLSGTDLLNAFQECMQSKLLKNEQK